MKSPRSRLRMTAAGGNTWTATTGINGPSAQHHDGSHPAVATTTDSSGRSFGYQNGNATNAAYSADGNPRGWIAPRDFHSRAPSIVSPDIGAGRLSNGMSDPVTATQDSSQCPRPGRNPSSGGDDNGLP